MMKKVMPNLLTTVRVVCSLALLFLSVFSVPFIMIYLAAGLSDMLDGFLARKWQVESGFGARYDGLADFVLIAVCLFKIWPVLDLKIWHTVWICVIALMKMGNLLMACRHFHKAFFLHTIANKVTGFLLFLSPVAFGYVHIDIIICILCIAASFAAVQEGYYIQKQNRVPD